MKPWALHHIGRGRTMITNHATEREAEDLIDHILREFHNAALEIHGP